MTIVAGAYWGLNGVISRKDGGRLPVSARIVLAPWLAGQQASLMYSPPPGGCVERHRARRLDRSAVERA